MEEGYRSREHEKEVVHRRSRNEFRRWMFSRDELGRAVNKACRQSIGGAEGNDKEEREREGKEERARREMGAREREGKKE